MKSASTVFIHGFLGSRKCCPFKNCRIIELPGHGKVKVEPDLSFDSYVDDLIVQIKRPVHLIGYSMGGRIAMKMAIKRPDLFTKITIISANPGGQGSENEAIKRLNTLNFKDFIKWWYTQDLFVGTNIEARTEETKHLDPQELALCLACFSKKNQGDLWDRLGAIENKLHYICGELDKKYMKIGINLKKRYPKICLSVLAGCSHYALNALKKSFWPCWPREGVTFGPLRSHSGQGAFVSTVFSIHFEPFHLFFPS
jgi:2-succinyl-6-hydroxy-2,4-cyclohexadiene-1-carboxylate synthase